VALLPPATVVVLTLGQGLLASASAAALLLAVNIAADAFRSARVPVQGCAAPHLVQARGSQAIDPSEIGWTIMLAVLVLFIWLAHGFDR